MGRKIPGRKHRGIRDPEKQAAVRFDSIKNKINAPPTNPDDQEVPKSLQKIIELKSKIKSGVLFKRNKQLKSEKENNKNKQHPKGKPEKPIRKFIQRPGETDREFVHRMNRICTEVVREAEFEDKYGVDIKRNEDGEVEEVVKREKDELELLLKKAKKKKQNEEKGGKKKKKKKDKPQAPKLSKWQKRKKKLDEKQQRKELQDVDEFKKYKDNVKFGEIAHAPPSLVAPRKAEKLLSAPRPGNKNLLLKSVINKKSEKESVEDIKNKESIKKTSNKVIDKKGRRKELPNSLRRQLDKQQKEIIEAYKKIKAQKYSR